MVLVPSSGVFRKTAVISRALQASDCRGVEITGVCVLRHGRDQWIVSYFLKSASYNIYIACGIYLAKDDIQKCHQIVSCNHSVTFAKITLIKSKRQKIR